MAVIIVAGMSISPTLIAGYGLIERQAPPERRTEGMTWLSSAISVGVATGSPLAGHLIDAYGARWGYLLAAACGFGAVLAVLAGLGRLRRPGGPADPPCRAVAGRASRPGRGSRPGRARRGGHGHGACGDRTGPGIGSVSVPVPPRARAGPGGRAPGRRARGDRTLAVDLTRGRKG